MDGMRCSAAEIRPVPKAGMHAAPFGCPQGRERERLPKTAFGPSETPAVGAFVYVLSAKVRSAAATERKKAPLRTPFAG